MALPGNLLTTAMAVMPHRDVSRALAMALSLDVPLWPQLPRYSYYEDMYVQASEHFPGIVLDMEKRTLRFSMEKFIEEVEDTMANFSQRKYFEISTTYSEVYHRFLKLDLSGRPAIRGQLEGPISFGFNVMDDNNRPILFDDTVRQFLIEFLAQRINVKLDRLKKMNPNAFVFIDEPGLQFIFSAMSGYGDAAARRDMEKRTLRFWNELQVRFFSGDSMSGIVLICQDARGVQDAGLPGADLVRRYLSSRLADLEDANITGQDKGDGTADVPFVVYLRSTRERPASC